MNIRKFNKPLQLFWLEFKVQKNKSFEELKLNTIRKCKILHVFRLCKHKHELCING